MATGKRYKKIIEGLDRDKTYTVEEAVKIILVVKAMEIHPDQIAADRADIDPLGAAVVKQ